MLVLADWRNPAQYPPPETTPLPRWHWEFLRRNGDYQADFERYLGLGVGASAQNERERLAHKYGLEGIMLDYREPYLELFRSPRRPEPARLVQWQTTWVAEDEDGNRIEGHLEDLSYLDPRLRQHECCVVFNMRMPLEDQLQSARKRVVGLQRRYTEKRGCIENYPLYLRLIDADAAGADEFEVRTILLPEVDVEIASAEIQIHLKAAKRLRDVDYRYI
ncbi:MAG: transcriptional regulator domain-containing protein [Gammaproteobacteria bacterium]